MKFEKALRIITKRTCGPCKKCFFELEQICLEEILKLKEQNRKLKVKLKNKDLQTPITSYPTLSVAQQNALEDFVFKVSMEGFSYAMENYPLDPIFPKKLRDRLLSLPTTQAEGFLEELMAEYNVEYS